MKVATEGSELHILKHALKKKWIPENDFTVPESAVFFKVVLL